MQKLKAAIIDSTGFLFLLRRLASQPAR